ncbi:acyltransferase family protein [uncultured Clostridium sp.]|uniref:acyltransferase family protein n=1 Tax=Clostridium sp. TaxID=1506 RepID=UPI00266FBF4C|nr:acyltransferase [uncultured Clostridium sp.]
MNVQKDRNIDSLRGLMIILVVLGHAIIPQIRENNEYYTNVWNTIYYFHMPIFFMISGYCCKEIKVSKIDKNKYKSFIIKKFKRLMIPYILMSCFNYIILLVVTTIQTPIRAMLIESGYKFNGIITSIIEILTFNGHFDDHMWFLYTLFIIFILIPIMKKKINNENKIIILSIILTLLSYSGILNNTVPLLEKTCRYLFYVIIGSKLNFNNISINKLIKCSGVNIVIIIVLLNLKQNNYVIATIEGILKIILSINFIYVLYYLVGSLILHKIFNKISKYSFQIYLLHQPFITSGIALISYKLLNLNALILIIISTIAGSLIPIAISVIFNNIKYGWRYRSNCYEKKV